MEHRTVRLNSQPPSEESGPTRTTRVDNSQGQRQVLKIVMEDLPKGEVAAMYQEGEDAIILVSRTEPDDARCRAVNDLLASVRAVDPTPSKASLLSPAPLLRLLTA